MIDHKRIHLFLTWLQLQAELFFESGKDVGGAATSGEGGPASSGDQLN